MKIDNRTTLQEARIAIAMRYKDELEVSRRVLYTDPAVVAFLYEWGFDLFERCVYKLRDDYELALLAVKKNAKNYEEISRRLKRSARFALDVYNNNTEALLETSWFYMSYNELYKAALLEHLEDPEEHWSYDIKNQLFIDRDNCAIHCYDPSNEIWRQLDECEIDALEGVGLYYFIGHSRDGSSYNLRTGEIIG